MNLYNVFGSINTLFIFVSLYGVLSQVRTIWRNKANDNGKGQATVLLSLNQFCVSYLAYFSFFIYGYSIAPFNHYIVWPRLVATLLVGIILFEIWWDRKSTLSLYTFIISILFTIVGIIGLFLGNTFIDEGLFISTGIILIISVLIAQGYIHQFSIIIKSGSTGAIDLKMSQFILMMDISTICFAFSMGLETGWPLLVLAITSAITKLIMMYLFRWVKISKKAKYLRTLQS